MMATTWKQMERAGRIERRNFMKQIGRKPARKRFIYHLATTIIAIPDWALEKAVPELTSTVDAVWLADDWLAKKLYQMDLTEGGKPELDRVEARRCKRCGMLRIGLLAEQRRTTDESALDGRKLPCSPDCVERSHQRRSRQ